MGTLERSQDLVQPMNVGLGGSDNDIGIRPLAVDDPPGLLQPHRHLPLGVSPGGDVIHRIELQFTAALDDAFDRL